MSNLHQEQQQQQRNPPTGRENNQRGFPPKEFGFEIHYQTGQRSQEYEGARRYDTEVRVKRFRTKENFLEFLNLDVALNLRESSVYHIVDVIPFEL